MPNQEAKEERPPDATDRRAWRQRLRRQREAYAESDEFAWAAGALGQHLDDVLRDLAPRCLGAYWPLADEFNPWIMPVGETWLARMQLALPRARREPRGMVYHRWDGRPPVALDDYGIPGADGEEVVPDVVLVPCLGFTRTGWRLGYGGGFFDRYLGEHPRVMAVGVAWACGEMQIHEFVPTVHDRPMSLIVCERGVVMS